MCCSLVRRSSPVGTEHADRLLRLALGREIDSRGLSFGIEDGKRELASIKDMVFDGAHIANSPNSGLWRKFDSMVRLLRDRVLYSPFIPLQVQERLPHIAGDAERLRYAHIWVIGAWSFEIFSSVDSYFKKEYEALEHQRTQVPLQPIQG